MAIVWQIFSADLTIVETAQSNITNATDATYNINKSSRVKVLEMKDGNVTFRSECPTQMILEAADIDRGSVETNWLKIVFYRWWY